MLQARHHFLFGWSATILKKNHKFQDQDLLMIDKYIPGESGSLLLVFFLTAGLWAAPNTFSSLGFRFLDDCSPSEWEKETLN